MGFEFLQQYEIPYLHPLAVHVPMVLLLLAAGVAVVYAARGTVLWRSAALVLLALGAAGAWFAVQTGETLAEAVEGEPMVDLVGGAHETAAEWTAWTSTVGALLFAGVAVWRRRQPATPEAADPLLVRLALLVAALAAAALVAWTGHLGGIMVWGVPA